MPAQRRRVGLLPARSQPGGDAQRQPVVPHRAVLPPAAGAGRRQSADLAHRQLQLRQHQRRAANPGGAPSGPAPAPLTEQQPCDAELEGEGPSGGAQSGIHTSLDTGADRGVLWLMLARLFQIICVSFVCLFLRMKAKPKKLNNKLFFFFQHLFRKPK